MDKTHTPKKKKTTTKHSSTCLYLVCITASTNNIIWGVLELKRPSLNLFGWCCINPQIEPHCFLHNYKALWAIVIKCKTSTLQKTLFTPFVSFSPLFCWRKLMWKDRHRFSPNLLKCVLNIWQCPLFSFPLHGSIRENSLCIQRSTMDNDFQSINLELLKLRCFQIHLLCTKDSRLPQLL